VRRRRAERWPAATGASQRARPLLHPRIAPPGPPPEHAAELKDALKAADHHALEVELRRDAQREGATERVVVRHERPRVGAAGDGLQHGRLDLRAGRRGGGLVSAAHSCATARHGGTSPLRRGSPQQHTFSTAQHPASRRAATSISHPPTPSPLPPIPPLPPHAHTSRKSRSSRWRRMVDMMHERARNVARVSSDTMRSR
jgi:hypothetical protein